MIPIAAGLSIPENEITFTASRSSGPGGQNVNKVSSKVTLAFDVNRSTALSDEQRRRILGRLAKRINKDGVLQIVSQRTRSQEFNRADALGRFCELLRRVLAPEKPRIKTRVTAAARERRIEKKKQRTMVKQARTKKGWDL